MRISARVCKVKLSMNLVHIGKISCLCLLSKCLCAMFMIFRASIQQYILDLLPNRICRLLQISAKHCRLVSVPPLTKYKIEFPGKIYPWPRCLELWFRDLLRNLQEKSSGQYLGLYLGCHKVHKSLGKSSLSPSSGGLGYRW